MGRNQREYERVPCSASVTYGFTSWDNRDHTIIKEPQITKAVDISLVGIGLDNLIEIKSSLAKKLIQGKKKVVLSIELYEGEAPVHLFARLIWVKLADSPKNLSHRMGLQFLDISKSSLSAIKRFLNEEKGIAQ